jgi:predicted ribosome quality control (RQC) complex YloA/Tae2 family protein
LHNNFYFLRKLSHALAGRISGFTIVSCFSQNKDELIMEFNDGQSSFFIKASLQPEFQCLSFPDAFHRAKKNSVDLFNNILMSKVTGTRQFENERSFAMLLENNFSLVFKMHGARSNVLLFNGETVAEIFRNNFTIDLELQLSQLDRTIDWSLEALKANESNLEKLYFTFGRQVWEYLARHHFVQLDSESKWKLLQKTLEQLDQDNFYIAGEKDEVVLTLLPITAGAKVFHDPIAAINEFFYRKVSSGSFEKKKAKLLSHLEGKLRQGISYLEKNRNKLEELVADTHYQQWADLLMANLHIIKPGDEKITVENFYDNQKPITIKLRKDLSPQRNAEIFYRKGKNQEIEITTLRESVGRKEKEIHNLQLAIEAAKAAVDEAVLDSVSIDMVAKSPDKKTGVSRPYHEFEWRGFRIWVGKNAAANDLLTLRFAFKEDLWLHAKDVAGSHVLIKHQAGKNFPKDVIERAAGLAAHYSKRKNETLCPVVVTPKKFVRKRKGDVAGAVVVERETVVMVKPEPWTAAI